MILGFVAIATVIGFNQFLHLPLFLGMTTGLGLLMFFGFHLKKRDRAADVAPENLSGLRGKG